MTKRYLASFSYAGENREYVEEVVHSLQSKMVGFELFYDQSYQAEITGPGLDTKLKEIYQEKSVLVVVFISKHYAEKVWCKHEMKLIREMIISQKNTEIMFFKLDNSELESLATTDAFIPIQRQTPAQVADMIVNRIIRQHIAVASEIHIPIPTILKDKLFMKYQRPLGKLMVICIATIITLMGILLIQDPRLDLNDAGPVENLMIGISILAFYIGAFSFISFFIIYIIRAVSESVKVNNYKQ